MNIVITGASGQYGRTAIELLLQKMPAEQLILMTRTPAKLEEYAQRGCRIRRGDFDDPASLVEAFEGADRLLLISGTRVGKRIAQHKAAIEAAEKAGVRHLVYTSFIAITKHNPSVAVQDHLVTEDMIRASSLEWTIMRDAHYADAMIVNAGPNFIASGVWASSSSPGRETLVWRDDCVECAVAVLCGEGHERQIYNITGSELLSLQEVCETLADVTGRPIQWVDTDDDGMYAIFDAMGIPREPVDDQVVKGISWNSDDMVTFERAVREGYFSVISDDVERLLGRPPRSVRELVEANVEMLRAVPPMPQP